MSAPIWLTNAGDLGIIPEEEYYEFFFDAYNPGGGNLTYSVISGSLPVGIELRPNGSMIGIPAGRVAGVPAAVAKVTTSTFTIRITNSDDLVADRTFSLTIAGILPQVITPTTSNLGSYLDGTYVNVDINTIEPNQYLQSTFTIIEGELPPGLSLNTVTGLISGYITPTLAANQFGEIGPTWTLNAASNNPTTAPFFTNYGPSFDWQNPDFPEVVIGFDVVGFDAVSEFVSKDYQFVIKADNGINIETQTYTISVIAISSLTADSIEYTADDVSIITADILGPDHNPVILTDAGSLGSVRQNTQVAIQIEALDYENDSLTFELVSGTLPQGLMLNTTTGWITGIIPLNSLGASTATFNVRCFKTTNPIYKSATKTFSITTIGQINDIVSWHTDSDLGVLYTGQISELYISASVPSGRVLNYSLAGSAGTLPYGLELSIDGLIIGRVSFETFILDSNTTTFDNGTTTFDRTYTFTVAVSDIGNFVYDTKTFTVRIVDFDEKPYENLYVQPYVSREQRAIFDSVLNNSDIFPENYLYRSSDKWFGKNNKQRSLFLAGLSPGTAAEYISAMTLNHYWKTLYFGEIKTAQALDENFNVKYEVVYIELIDTGVNENGVGPNLSVDLPANSRNISTIYPNSFPNMASRIEQNIGYENRGVIPSWMTSRQKDGTVLGFIRALVLAYTLPDRSAEIAYRVRLVQSQFQLIDYTIDRYEWDNSLSRIYNKTANAYISNNFVIGTGTITANTSSNIVLGITSNITGNGTIFGSAGTNTITGVNTNFNTELRINKPIYSANTGNLLGTISSIRSATEITISSLLTESFANISYVATINQTRFTTELHVDDTLLVNNNVIIGTVKTITNDSNVTLYSNCLANISNSAFLYSFRDTVGAPGDGDKYLKYPQVKVIS